VPEREHYLITRLSIWKIGKLTLLYSQVGIASRAGAGCCADNLISRATTSGLILPSFANPKEENEA
jgi:hypothetical protein